MTEGDGGAGEAPLPLSDWLALLDPDEHRAEEIYNGLKRDLTRFLEWRHHIDPEAAAQEALFRGLKRMAEGADYLQAGPRGYLFGFARNLVKEGWRVRKREEPLDPAAGERLPSTGREHRQVEAKLMLDKALGLLSERDRAILVRYCTEDDHLDHSRELNVTPGNLRVMVHRIKNQIKKQLG
jgi:DNA-directed RNA polymerase specialized sigma24 family protein